MKIENVKEFAMRTKCSKASIYRFYKKNPEIWEATIMKRNKRYFPVEHARYFDSEIMFDENRILQQENSSMRNVIQCLTDKGTLQNHVWYMDWSFFLTVAYKTDRNKKSCFKMMHRLYESLLATFGNRCSIRIFFTTEPFINRQGYHNHAVLHVSECKFHEEVQAHIQDFFSFDRVDFKIYDKYKAGIFYSVKSGLVNEDWNILGNNLGKDTLKTTIPVINQFTSGTNIRL